MISPSGVFASVNRERRRRGRKPYRFDSRLARIGEDRAKRAYRTETHPGPGSFAMTGQWSTAAEALAWIHSRPAPNPVKLWLASHEGHRQIVLGKQWTHAGVGVYRRLGTIVVALIVADRRA